MGSNWVTDTGLQLFTGPKYISKGRDGNPEDVASSFAVFYPRQEPRRARATLYSDQEFTGFLLFPFWSALGGWPGCGASHHLH